MDSLSPRFWLTIFSVVVTLHTVIFYTLTPSESECQMTFMMEPPRFIPIPIAEDSLSITVPAIPAKEHLEDKSNDYKLFMYSELGFPSSSNPNIDLRDSMPVLFIPGNAGSYQQVRSIASTSIRDQLQSLDAAKFIFYTLDFRAQLSGFNGALIESQTRFVHLALRQIARMHSSEVKGVIIVAHSVGGFISKLLFEEPNFDSSSIPLLINLASPLIKPYLMFDDKMQQLYDRANSIWSKASTRPQTIAISLSGGRSDRLVPMHLSMDDSYDISTHTKSVRDVWLPADHVCITWCREITQKISKLLSKMMDKKKTQVIEDRKTALSVARKELLDEEEMSKFSFQSIWRSRKSVIATGIEDHLSITRSKLMDYIHLVNVSSTGSLLMVIDHISELKPEGVIGCRMIDTNYSSNQVTCKHGTDLLEYSKRIPTKKYDTKKTVISIDNDRYNYVDYIILNLGIDDRFQKTTKIATPEQVTIQKLTDDNSFTLHIPNLIVTVIKKLLAIQPRLEFSKTGNPTNLVKIMLVKPGRGFLPSSLYLTSSNCTDNQPPVGPHILVYRSGFLEDSVQPISTSETSAVAHIIINAKSQTNFGEDITTDTSRTIALYLDGRCQTKLVVDLTLPEVIRNIIQNDLQSIILCLVYSVSTSLLSLLLSNTVDGYKTISADFLKFLPYAIINLILGYIESPQEDLTDIFFHMTFLYLAGLGLHATTGFLIKRLIDVSIIINRIQTHLRTQLVSQQTSTESVTPKANGSTSSKHYEFFNSIDYEWVLISLIVAASHELFVGMVPLYCLLELIKLGLAIELDNPEHDQTQINRHICRGYCSQTNTHQGLKDLNIYIAGLVLATLLTTLPKSIIQVRNFGLSKRIIYDTPEEALIFFTTVITIIVTKLYHDKVINLINSKAKSSLNGKKHNQKQTVCRNEISVLARFLFNSLVAFLALTLERNICRVSYMLLTVCLLTMKNMHRVFN